ncbi:RNA-directed DNA polymerase, eukaryota, partial [Tanacetum coccineum]
PAVGNSGGVLCVWDVSVFVKSHVTISDYFVMIEDRWKGEVIRMGYFNEVRMPSERHGSVFNKQRAALFNSFILSSGLIKVSLGGYTFTWVQKHMAKMSKLDRFLVSEGLMTRLPTLSGIILDRHLSDHRPILLRELVVDYGPTPFRLFHSWFMLNGFDRVVVDSWQLDVVTGDNAMTCLKKKFQDLKGKLREWSHASRSEANDRKLKIQMEIQNIDRQLDIGECGEDLLSTRRLLCKELLDIDNVKVKELAQKAKVKWAIEGDENLKFFHGSILVNGSPTQEFQFHKGLRQGDPLSPFLFLLIMESLHISFSKDMHQGFFKGIKIGFNDTVCLSHLFYADDAIFIGECNKKNLLNFVRILQCFFLASGLRINLYKCSIIEVGGVKTEEVSRKATLIGCDIGKTPFK